MERLAAIAFVLACLVGLAACASAPSHPPPPPQAGDCTTLGVWSNGYHTSLAIRAEDIPAEHPVRVLYPEAAYFLIGWGERNYFMDPDPGIIDAVAAVLPPSRSALQVMAHSAPLEDTLWRPQEMITVAVSEEGMAALVDAIADSLENDADGMPLALGEGRLPEKSMFLAARPKFHLFYMCNQWTAERLSEAGVRLKPAFIFTAGSLLNSAANGAPSQCPNSLR